MFNIRVYNERGSGDFGGGKSDSNWKITAADGLAFCGRNFTYARYTGTDGQRITDVSLNARTITLSGDVVCDSDGFAREFNRVMTVLEDEGILEINTILGKRNIRARCCDFSRGDKKGGYMLFVVQFICEDPYFEDADKTEVALFERVPYIDKDFTFPGIFSGRISRRNIEYNGTRRTEPVFYISIDEGVSG